MSFPHAINGYDGIMNIWMMNIVLLVFFFYCLFCILDIVKPLPMEDKLDQLNTVVTTTFLLSFAVLTLMNQAFGRPLKCLIPKSDSNYGISYFENTCLTSSISEILDYNVKLNTIKDYRTIAVLQYQFIPIVLFLQGLLFLSPRLFWLLAVNWKAEQIENIIDCAKRMIKVDEPMTGMEFLAKYIERSQNSSDLKFGQSLATYYAIKKWLALLNVMGQFLFMAYLIPWNFDIGWAVRVMSSRFDDTISDVDVVEQFFPFFIGCKINTTTYEGISFNGSKSVMWRKPVKSQLPCVVLGNFFTEKFYIFLYFWLILLFALNLYSAIRFTAIILSRNVRKVIANFIFPPTIQLCYHAPSVKQLGVKAHMFASPYLLDYFLERILKADGLILFLFINFHCGPFITQELCQQFWNIFVQPPCNPKNVTVSKATDHLSIKWQSFRKQSLKEGTKFETKEHQKILLHTMNLDPGYHSYTEYMNKNEESDESGYADDNNNLSDDG